MPVCGAPGGPGRPWLPPQQRVAARGAGPSLRERAEVAARAPQGPSGAAPGRSLPRVEGNGFGAGLGRLAESKPTARPRFFAVFRAELPATPPRQFPLHPTFLFVTWCLADFVFSVPSQGNLRGLHRCDSRQR